MAAAARTAQSVEGWGQASKTCFKPTKAQQPSCTREKKLRESPLRSKDKERTRWAQGHRTALAPGTVRQQTAETSRSPGEGRTDWEPQPKSSTSHQPSTPPKTGCGRTEIALLQFFSNETGGKYHLPFGLNKTFPSVQNKALRFSFRSLTKGKERIALPAAARRSGRGCAARPAPPEPEKETD